MKIRNYKYLAINEGGKQVKGRIEAINRGACTKLLQTKNYEIKSLVEYRNILTDLSQITIGKSFKTKQLIFFLKQLGSLLTAGVSIIEALELLSLQQDKNIMKRIYFELYQQIYNGLSFSRALANRPKEFPKLLIQMIEIGEISGNLDSTVLKMGDYYEKQAKLTSEIKGVIRMPIIYMIATAIISIGMIIFVFPNIADLYLSFGDAELPFITKMFIDLGEFMSKYALIIFGGIAISVITILLLNKYVKAFHYWIVKAGLKLPIFGKLIQMNNQIIIANSLSQMLSSGVRASKALQTISHFIPNVIYRDLMLKTLKYIEDGSPFSKSFEENKYIDPVMAKLIATGEKTGDIPGLMKNLALYYNGVSELRVEQLKNSLQPILLMFVYAIVGVLIIAIMMPMLTLGGQI